MHLAPPVAHFLESWGDARAWDGTLTVLQPLIEPLYGGRSAIELLAAALGERARASGHDLVRATLTPRRRRRLRRRVADGRCTTALVGHRVARGRACGELASPWSPRSAPLAAAIAARLPTADAPELRPGRRPQAARRPLRQQRLAAGAAGPAHQAHLGQRRAGLAGDRPRARRRHGDVAAVAAAGVTARAAGLRRCPARRRTIADGRLRLRPHGGRAGSAAGVGVDVYPLRRSAAPWLPSGVVDQLDRPARTTSPRTQDHHAIDTVRLRGPQRPRRHAGARGHPRRVPRRTPRSIAPRGPPPAAGVAVAGARSTRASSGAWRSTSTPASAATPASSPARPRTTSRWSARTQVLQRPRDALDPRRPLLRRRPGATRAWRTSR